MKNKLLIFGILFLIGLIFISSANAYFYGYDFNKISSTYDVTNCRANNWTSCNQISYYRIWDFDISKKDLSTLNNLFTSVNNFDGYLFINYDNRIKQSPLNTSIENFSVYCVIRSPDIDNTSQNIIINKTYTINNIDDDINSSWYYIQMNAGEQLFCNFNTNYYNNSVFYEVNALYSFLYLPTYKSTYDYNKVILDKDVTIENLESKLNNKYKSYTDIAVDGFGLLIKINVAVLSMFYWIFKIAILIFSVLLVFYLIFVLYRYIQQHF